MALRGIARAMDQPKGARAGMADLFDASEPAQSGRAALAEGAVILRGFALPAERDLLAGIAGIARAAPFRNMLTPGGRAMSVAMTNCGAAGWVTDARGYRYAARDPQTDLPWPEMPQGFAALAGAAAAEAGYGGFCPDACLINRYAPGARMSLHQDKDERDMSRPIVSVSLGLPAIFQFGGTRRGDPVARHPLRHGDVVVWGGPARLNYHGVPALKPGEHPLTGPFRLNLTFRAAL